MLQILKAEFKQRIREDELLQAKIAAATVKRISTVKRWVEDDHIMLTTSTVLDVIREHYGIARDIELTEAKEAVAA